MLGRIGLCIAIGYSGIRQWLFQETCRRRSTYQNRTLCIFHIYIESALAGPFAPEQRLSFHSICALLPFGTQDSINIKLGYLTIARTVQFVCDLHTKV